MQVADLGRKLRDPWLYSKYVEDDDLEGPFGLNGIRTPTTGFPQATPGNYVCLFDVVLQELRQFKYIMLTPGVVDVSANYTTYYGLNGQTPWQWSETTCGEVLEGAYDSWNQSYELWQSQGSPGSSPGGWDFGWGYIPDGYGFLSSVNYVSGNDYPLSLIGCYESALTRSYIDYDWGWAGISSFTTWDIYVANRRGRFQVSMPLSQSGKAVLYLKAAAPGSGPYPGQFGNLYEWFYGPDVYPGNEVDKTLGPVLADERWHAYESLVFDENGVGSSSLFGDQPVRGLPCPIMEFADPYARVMQGWYLYDYRVVITPVWKYPVPGLEECTSCTKGCLPGDVDVQTGSLDFKANLGLNASDKTAGYLFLKERKADASTATASRLLCQPGVGTQVILGEGGVLRQVLTSQALADIVTINEFKYEIRLYTRANAGSPDSAGIYQPSGSSYRTVTIENPDGATSFNRLRITEKTGTTSKVNEFVYTQATQAWELIRGNGTARETRSSVIDSQTGDRVETLTFFNGNNTVASKEVNTYRGFPWGSALIRKVVDPDGAAQTTTWSYNEDSRFSGYGQVKEMIRWDGYWERYAYDSLNRQIKVVACYGNGAVGAAENLSRVTTTTYGNSNPAITVVETALGQEVERRYTVFRPNEAQEIQAWTAGAAWDDPRNLVTVVKTYGGGAFLGEVRSIRNPDGTMTLYEYVKSGSQKVTTVRTGAPNGAGSDIADGTRTVTVVDEGGHTLSEISYDIASSLLLSSVVTTGQDEFGRPTRTDYNDGTFMTTVYGCCGPESETDREGVTTTYMYDELGRVIASTRAGITTLTSYDAVGRVLNSTRVGSDNSEVTLKTSTYDAADRLVSSTDALGNTTGYSENINGLGQRVKTTTYADGTTRVETFLKDGKPLSVTGTAVHPLEYEYGVDGNGFFTKTIQVGDGGSNTEWVKESVDILGRSYKTTFADGTVNQRYFNDQGQLVRQVDGDGVTMLYQYNAKGEQEYTAIDMNGNGTIDLAGPDQVTRSSTSVVSANGTTVVRAVSEVYGTDNSDAAQTVLIQERSSDGLKTWQTNFGLTTQTQTSINSATATHTTVVTAPDGTTTTSAYQNGLLMSFTTRNSELGTLNSATLTYDSHQRQATATDARGIVTTTAYNNLDQATSITVAGVGDPAQTTSDVLDNRGRILQRTLPDGGVVNYEYFATGELKKQSGARTYTSEYTYDAQGRMKTLLAGSEITTWNYTSDRGFLASKIFADGKGVNYTYTPNGRLKTRTWARGITTTYAYNAAGELSNTSYSDGTPAVGAVYDRRGRNVSSSSSSSSCEYSFNDAGELLSETYTSGPLNGISINNTYDALLRRSSFSATGNSQFSILNSQFSYDSASRLITVSDGANSADYTYLPDSSLVSGLTFKQGTTTRMTTTRNYDTLNRLTQISSQSSVLSPQSFSYTYNNANQRTKSTLGDNSYWNYEYDSLGQVTSGKKFFSDNTPVSGQQFDYAFDSIGNRTESTVNGRQSTYSANALNQYTQRSIPGFVDVYGTAKADAVITVNNQAVDRNGESFSKTFAVDNTTGAVYEPISVTGVKNDVGSGGEDAVVIEAGNVFVPRTPETFSYDDDGNLLSDGRWNYIWDAENRLIAMETLTGLPSEARRRMEFVYDNQGRRIQKKSYIWNTQTSTYNLLPVTSYLYDGWNLIAELSPQNSALRTYLWGQDLSGTMQGAGGVGGLLFISQPSALSPQHFVCHDGNGNVAALVDSGTGEISAEYEYGPFGETVRATGAMAKGNPIRFSSKYQDEENGLLYYGYRYYNPSTGRWLNRDPIEEKGGLNLYGFVGNDAINAIDPHGLAAFLSWLAERGLTELTADATRRELRNYISEVFVTKVSAYMVRRWATELLNEAYETTAMLQKGLVADICFILAEIAPHPVIRGAATALDAVDMLARLQKANKIFSKLERRSAYLRKLEKEGFNAELANFQRKATSLQFRTNIREWENAKPVLGSEVLRLGYGLEKWRFSTRYAIKWYAWEEGALEGEDIIYEYNRDHENTRIITIADRSGLKIKIEPGRLFDRSKYAPQLSEFY